MPRLSFPSLIILSTIQEKHIYKDERSVEKSTKITKRKYKLAAKWPEVLKSQNIRIFFVSTSNSASVQKRVSVEIKESDYSECRFNNLRNSVSYYDLTKREILSGDEVKAKIDDPFNGFKDVATINDAAFKKFLDKTEKLKIQSKPPVSVQDIKNIAKSVADKEISDKLLRELHLT
jgi:hypothetical protein